MKVQELGSKRDFITLEEVLDFHLEYGVSVAAIIHQAWEKTGKAARSCGMDLHKSFPDRPSVMTSRLNTER